MPVRAPSRRRETVYVSMAAQPSACWACAIAGQPSISDCRPTLPSGRHGAGAVEYTPTEYLLMMPPLAPTNP
jgi:hypothetical protein